MNEKQFEIDDVTYTVSVSYFQPPIPGKLSGPPEDCYPDEGAEIEFDDNVEYAQADANEVSTMDFCDFVMIYAAEHTKGDTDKSQQQIENETIIEILIEAGEREPQEPDYEFV